MTFGGEIKFQSLPDLPKTVQVFFGKGHSAWFLNFGYRQQIAAARKMHHAEKLDQLAIEIRRLISQGLLDEARSLSESLDDLRTTSLAETRLICAVFLEVGKSGWAQVAMDRYIESNPSDSDAILDRIEAQMKARVDVSGALPSVHVITYEQYMRKATLLSRSGLKDIAILIYGAAIAQEPAKSEAHRGLIENLNWSGQAKLARRALRELIRVMPDQAYSWAFVAEHASLAADKRLFATAARHAEALLKDHDEFAAFTLARALSHNKDLVGVDRMFCKMAIPDIQSSWMLSEMLLMAAKHGLTNHQVSIAGRLRDIGTSDPRALDLTKEILSIHSSAGERGLWKVDCPDAIFLET